jgi:hypothetical protein
MGNPTLTTHYEVYSPGADTTTLTTPSFTPPNGEVIVVKASTWSTADGMGTPTGGGQTYTPAQITAPGGFNGWSGTWVCTVSGSPGAFAISSAPLTANNTRHMMVVERWGSAFVAATPAVFSAPVSGVGALSTSLTTTAPNSVISLSIVDLGSRDPAGHTWTPVAMVDDGLFDGHVGSNSVQYSAYTPVPSAGATTVTLTIPAGNPTWVISGVEIKAATAAIVDFAATFTASGTMTAPMVREVPFAASLTGNGTMTAALTREVTFPAALSASGTMTAPMVNETHLAANFTASGNMTAAFNVPTLGPPDLIATPVASALLACLTTQLNELPSPPAKIELRAGAETGPLIGPNVDECCAGLGWVRVASVYPSWDSFPAADNTWTPCGPFAYAVVLEMGTAFCMPWSDSDQEFDNMDPPSTSDWATAHATLMQHQNLLRRAAACCFPATQRRAVGEWTPLSVEGGCLGGTLRVTVSVMNPCSDC